MPVERVIERRPLCPPSPPPRLSRTVANGRSSSSWITTRSSTGQVVVVEQAAHRPAGLVHVRRRPGQHHAPAGQPAFTGDGARPRALARRQPDAGPVGQLVEHHRADVVPVPGVPGAGVAQPDDQERPLGRSGRPRGAGGAGAPGGSCSRSARTAQDSSPTTGGVLDSQRTPRPRQPPRRLPPRARRLLALDAGLGLGLGELGLERLGGRGVHQVDDERGRVGDQGAAAGQGQVAGDEALAGGSRPVTSTSIASGMLVASASIETVFSSMLISVSGAVSPVTCTGTSTVTFSPRRTTSRSTCSCLRVSGSRWTALVSASCSLPPQDDGQQGVAAAVAQRRGELAGRQGQVDDVLAVPVQDGGDATLATGATGAALAELGAGLCFEAEVSHGDVLLRRWIGSAGRRTSAAHRQGRRPRGTHVDHGAELPRRAL